MAALLAITCSLQPARLPSALAVPAPAPLLNGADVSWLPAIEQDGSKFFDAKSKQVDPLTLMKSAGLSVARVRLWVSPPDKHSSLTEVLALAKRIKAAKLQLVLDIHFSDWWADPANQKIPVTWSGLSQDKLVRQVSSYTSSVLARLNRQGTSPSWVQIGNEIANGLLWPNGKLNSWSNAEFTAMSNLLNAATSAVKNSSSHPKVMIHLETGGDASKTNNWLTNAFANGLTRPNAIGLSYYPQWSGSLDAVSANIKNIVDHFGLPVAIAETAYLNSEKSATHQLLDSAVNKLDGLAQTASGQAAYAAKICSVLRESAGNKALGVWWWEGFSPNASRLRDSLDASQISSSSLVTTSGKTNAAMISLGKGSK
jgi:arabinogalactan endo-1,4-beta-galactosidase